MRERAIRFGKTSPLVGILTEPAAGARAAGPAVVLLNSGILHHIGACRLHVGIARRLAAQGITVLRFDHGGIGDSEPRRDKLTFEESAVVETREAMDYLAEKTGARTFALMGLCSGADMAFRVATVDERVTALVQLDAWAYRTFGYWVHHYGPRLLRVATWKHWVRRKLGLVSAQQLPPRDPSGVSPEYRRRIPPQESIERDLKALVARGVQLYLLFTGGQGDRYNHRRQYAASFRRVPFGSQLRVDYLPDADHIFTGLSHQQYAVNAIGEWTTQLAAAPAERRSA
jgi:hypothetical protein